MKAFESFMAPTLEEYVAYRKNLGCAKRWLRFSLFLFDQYVKEKEKEERVLPPSFFLELRKDLKQDPKTINLVLSALRGFFQFLVRQDRYEHNPLQDIPPLPTRFFIPFVFSPQQIDQLLAVICKQIRKNKKHFLIDLAVYQAILLLARCGMRISEPLRLLRNHYRREEGTIYIEKTKFKKDRLIPVPKDVLIEIEQYLVVRNSLISDDQNPYLLAGRNQKALTMDQIYAAFHQAIKDIGLDQPRQIIADMTFGSPTPHSLRHSFAINTLKRLTDEGKGPQHALPVLAAFMGHRKYHYTGAYLKVSDPKDVQGLIDFAKSQLDVI